MFGPHLAHVVNSSLMYMHLGFWSWPVELQAKIHLMSDEEKMSDSFTLLLEEIVTFAP